MYMDKNAKDILPLYLHYLILLGSYKGRFEEFC